MGVDANLLLPQIKDNTEIAKIIKTSFTISSGISNNVDIVHNLGYAPTYIGYAYDGTYYYPINCLLDYTIDTVNAYIKFKLYIVPLIDSTTLSVSAFNTSGVGRTVDLVFYLLKDSSKR